MGERKMDAKLNNAVAATAIGAFLRRLRRQGRDPDRWEAEHAIRAMAFLARDQYRKAIDRIGRALIPPSKRNPAAVADIEKATGHFFIPSLAALQAVLDEVCDGPEAFTGLIGWAAASEATELVRQEKKTVTVLFEPSDRVMMARYRGLLSPETLATVDNFVASFVGQQGYFRSIYDLSDIAVFAIPRPRLLERARKPRMNPGQDRVFVVPQPLIREMYHDYAQVQRDIGNGEMVLVETLTEALHRLRLRNPDFRPVPI
jgi:hypothetical protein